MKRNVLEGKLIYNWLVLAYAGNWQHKSYYQCKCLDCGNVYLRRADKLLAGKTRRCRDCTLAIKAGYNVPLWDRLSNFKEEYRNETGGFGV